MRGGPGSGAEKTTGAGELRRFRPYPAYKDSGVEWLDEIPKHWEVRRLKYLASLNSRNIELIRYRRFGTELVMLDLFLKSSTAICSIAMRR
jgi:hypothetical protein